MYMIYYFIMCILWFTGATTAVIFGAATRDNEDVDSDAALAAGGAAYIVGSVAIVFFFCNLFNLCAALRYSTCMLILRLIPLQGWLVVLLLPSFFTDCIYIRSSD